MYCMFTRGLHRRYLDRTSPKSTHSTVMPMGRPQRPDGSRLTPEIIAYRTREKARHRVFMMHTHCPHSVTRATCILGTRPSDSREWFCNPKQNNTANLVEKWNLRIGITIIKAKWESHSSPHRLSFPPFRLPAPHFCCQLLVVVTECSPGPR